MAFMVFLFLFFSSNHLWEFDLRHDYISGDFIVYSNTYYPMYGPNLSCLTQCHPCMAVWFLSPCLLSQWVTQAQTETRGLDVMFLTHCLFSLVVLTDLVQQVLVKLQSKTIFLVTCNLQYLSVFLSVTLTLMTLDLKFGAVTVWGVFPLGGYCNGKSVWLLHFGFSSRCLTFGSVLYFVSDKISTWSWLLLSK